MFFKSCNVAAETLLRRTVRRLEVLAKVQKGRLSQNAKPNARLRSYPARSCQIGLFAYFLGK